MSDSPSPSGSTPAGPAAAANADTLATRQQRLAVHWRRCEVDAARSLARYLAHVVVDASPAPRPFGDLCETWQRTLAAALIPAMEQLAGLRPVSAGPKSFFIVLPRGHDKTGLLARIANWAIAFSRRQLTAVVAAADREQAGLLLTSMRAEAMLNPWLNQRLQFAAESCRGTGGVLHVLSSDAPSSSGLKGDLFICDELTFWPKRDLFDVLWSGREKRAAAVFLIITNAGFKNSWQHDLLESALQSPAHWYVFQSPAGVPLAGWMSPERIAAMRSLLPAPHARRVLDNEWIAEAQQPLLDHALILACQADCLWNCIPPGRNATSDNAARAAAGKNAPGDDAAGDNTPINNFFVNNPPTHSRVRELYLGIDVGRVRDRSVIWTFELLGDVAWTREIAVFENTPFAVQRAEILRRITKQVVAVRIDQGGLGFQLAEELMAAHPGIVQGVQLTPGRQGQMALSLKTAFEQRRLRIPADPLLMADFRLVEQVATSDSGLPILKTHRDSTGHADRFWAAALAWLGIPATPRRSSAALPRGIPGNW